MPHPQRRPSPACFTNFPLLATALPTGAISRTYLHHGKKVGKAKSLGEGGGVVRISPDDEATQGLFVAEASPYR